MGALLGGEIEAASGRRREERRCRENKAFIGPVVHAQSVTWQGPQHMCKGTDTGATLSPLGSPEALCVVTGFPKSGL